MQRVFQSTAFIFAFTAFFALSVLPVSAQSSGCCRCKAPGATSASTCVTPASNTACPNLPSTSVNASVKALTDCVADAVCKPVASGSGSCGTGPVGEIAYGGSAVQSGTGTPVPVTPPSLNIAIPGLVFSTQIVEKQGYLEIPFFAQYVSAIYKFLIVIAAVASAVMIVYGGFLYIVAATGAKVRKGREIIVDACIGLALVLGAYVILNTINPDTLKLNALKISLVKPDPMSYLGGRLDAAGTLTETGIKATGGSGKNHTIPAECPGRDPSFSEPGNEKYANLGGLKVTKANYALNSGGRTLDQATIDFYIKEQQRTGVPAAVIIAQIVTEAGRGAVYSLVNGQAQSIFYNYGGIGCTQRQVPEGSCAHVAFGPQAFEFATKKPHPVPCTSFNSSQQLGASCVSLCQTSSRDTYTSCGPNCYPQKSHASMIHEGVEIWIPSVQCSRKFKSSQEFLDEHLGFVKPCLPYQDSVYKFAYCIGASTYAGTTGSKAIALAEIIERNCLCDPKTDSLGCVRNKELEQKLAKNVLKKRNLYDSQFYKNGVVDYDAVTKALFESTQGLLKAGEKLPQNDIVIPPDQN